jgi:hypothetical protein
MRAKKLPDPPPMVVEMKAEYDVNYIGPLPRAQRMQIVESINQFIGNRAAVAEVFPQVLDIPDMDEIAREVARLSGVPAKLIRDEKAVKDERDKKEKAQAKAMASAQAQEDGIAAQEIGKGAQAMNEATGTVQ